MNQDALVSLGYINLVKSMRNLMAQLAYLTKLYFTAVFSGYGSPEAITNKLNSLPDRFEEKAELIFGVQLSEEFLNLLLIHVVYIQEFANALASGNQEAINYYTQLIYENAGNIASQYAKMNPFWDEAQWTTLLYNYASLIIQDALALANQEFEKELDIFERMLLAALAMGDYLGEGLYQYLTLGLTSQQTNSV